MQSELQTNRTNHFIPNNNIKLRKITQKCSQFLQNPTSEPESGNLKLIREGIPTNPASRMRDPAGGVISHITSSETSTRIERSWKNVAFLARDAFPGIYRGITGLRGAVLVK